MGWMGGWDRAQLAAAAWHGRQQGLYDVIWHGPQSLWTSLRTPWGGLVFESGSSHQPQLPMQRRQKPMPCMHCVASVSASVCEACPCSDSDRVRDMLCMHRSARSMTRSACMAGLMWHQAYITRHATSLCAWTRSTMWLARARVCHMCLRCCIT